MQQRSVRVENDNRPRWHIIETTTSVVAFRTQQSENESLQSQCGSLMEQLANNSSAATNSQHQTSTLKQQLITARVDFLQLEKDKDNIEACYERQTMELEGLLQDNKSLKEMLQQSDLQVSGAIERVCASSVSRVNSGEFL